MAGQAASSTLPSGPALPLPPHALSTTSLITSAPQLRLDDALRGRSGPAAPALSLERLLVACCLGVLREHTQGRGAVDDDDTACAPSTALHWHCIAGHHHHRRRVSPGATGSRTLPLSRPTLDGGNRQWPRTGSTPDDGTSCVPCALCSRLKVRKHALGPYFVRSSAPLPVPLSDTERSPTRGCSCNPHAHHMLLLQLLQLLRLGSAPECYHVYRPSHAFLISNDCHDALTSFTF